MYLQIETEIYDEQLKKGEGSKGRKNSPKKNQRDNKKIDLKKVTHEDKKKTKCCQWISDKFNTFLNVHPIS